MTQSQTSNPPLKRLCEQVKSYRKKHQLTLDELSTITKVSRSMLSQIERGQANPTLAVACRIAEAFDISIGDLVNQPWVSSAIQVIAGDDQSHIYRNDEQCRVRTLSPLNIDKSIEFYEITLAAGASLQSLPHFEGTKELFTLTHGQVKIVVGDDEKNLKSKDSACYRADEDHAIFNTGEDEAVGFMVVTYLK